MEYFHTPSQSCGGTIYTVSRALYLSLLSCLPYCSSLAMKPFLYSINVLTVHFYSNTILSDCIPFKNTTAAMNNLIQTHSKKDSNIVRHTTVVIRLNKTHIENTQGKHTTKKISVFVGNTYYRDTQRNYF